jgi:hypothetical protein
MAKRKNLAGWARDDKNEADFAGWNSIARISCIGTGRTRLVR